MTRGSSTPPRQRDRVLFSCAAAERAPDGALLFDQDGMPIPLDSLFGATEDVTHPFAVVSAEQAPSPVSPEAAREPSTDPIRRVGAAGRPAHPRVHHGRTRKDDTKESFLSRRRDGLAEAVGLAACVAAATGALALWPSPHSGGASNMDGTSLLLHRGAPASHSAQPVPSGDGVPGAPPQAATSKPGASPTPSTSTTAPATAPPTAPPTTAGPDRPAPPPVSGPPSTEQPAPTPTESSPTSEPSTPTTTPTPDPTPTPSDTPTDANSDTPAPDPSSS